MHKEMTGLLGTGTVNEFPGARKTPGSPCVFNRKIRRDGLITKTQATSVRKGFRQVQKFNFEGTFVSTPATATSRLLTARACSQNE